MPAHKPAQNIRNDGGIIGVIQRKPAWLIPISGALLILLMLTVLIVAPSKKTNTQVEEESTGNVQQAMNVPLKRSPEAIKYVNKQLGFQLYIPISWKDKYVVTELPDEVIIDYINGENKAELVTIRPIPEESWRDLKKKPYLLSSKKGIVFGYTTPSLEENPFTASESAERGIMKEYQQFLSDVPSVAQTFEFVQ